MPVVVGSPRSGTTLLRFMLDSHPELAIPPETGFLPLGSRLRGRGDRLRERFFQAVTSFPRTAPAWSDFEIPTEAFWQALLQITPFTVTAGFRTFYRLYAARFGKPRWGDKTPLYCLAIDSIREVLPEARFVHLIRDGRDAALSLRHLWFSPGSEIETQAAYWRRCITAARGAGLGRPDYVELRYEDLILRPRETLERICPLLDLRYDEAMTQYPHRTRERLREHKGRSAPDGKLLVTQQDRLRQQGMTMHPPDPRRIGVWKTQMNAHERERFHRVAGGLLRELGYET